jgi:hypothetical protein
MLYRTVQKGEDNETERSSVPTGRLRKCRGVKINTVLSREMKFQAISTDFRGPPPCRSFTIAYNVQKMAEIIFTSGF